MSVKVRYSSEYLEHSGIKGQKWGVRRYQNKDGSLTPEGRKRYSRIRRFGKSLGDASKAELSDMRKHTKELIRELKNFPNATKKQRRSLIQRGVAKMVEGSLNFAIPVPVVDGYIAEHAGNVVRRMK